MTQLAERNFSELIKTNIVKEIHIKLYRGKLKAIDRI